MIRWSKYYPDILKLQKGPRVKENWMVNFGKLSKGSLITSRGPFLNPDEVLTIRFDCVWSKKSQDPMVHVWKSEVVVGFLYFRGTSVTL